jgi:hypothetical protein
MERHGRITYGNSTRMEITCGEAPYLVSRYGALSMVKPIPLKRRIGMLDRKMSSR